MQHPRCKRNAWITREERRLRTQVASLFLMVDETEDSNPGHWWVVYMAGLPVFGTPIEEKGDEMVKRLKEYVLRALGLSP